MASITIRNLEDDLKQRLRVRAAEHGRSMEEEAREILRRVVGESAPPRNLAFEITGAERLYRATSVWIDMLARSFDGQRQRPTPHDSVANQ